MWPEHSSRLIGMGCMRLSTEPDRDDSRAVELLHAAFGAGVTFLDTADAYCLDASEMGHNERLVARAIATWNGDRSRIVVGTKGGLTRPHGHWVADGRARYLIAACETSLKALAVERIALYQLHAPDPRTAFSTSVRALDSLKRDGRIEAIGLCNVSLAQIEEARAITDIATVQVELGPWSDGPLLDGVARYCIEEGIRLLAHRPLGGPRRSRRIASDPALREVAARHQVTPFDAALAWLLDLSSSFVPIPGPTRLENARSIAVPYRVALTGDDRALLDERFPAGQFFRESRALRRLPPPAPQSDQSEVVLIMGLPGAGKSTAAQELIANGYARLNRDQSARTLKGLLPLFERLIAAGHRRFVLDNTYVTRKARAPVIHAAVKAGLPVRCVWLSTSLEDAQVNAVQRMLHKYGRLLEPEETRRTGKRDPTIFAPTVLFRFQRQIEPPAESEGFFKVDIVPFTRARDASFTNRALIVWCDVLRRTRVDEPEPASLENVEPVPGRADVLRTYAADDWQILGLSWQPGIAAQTVTAEGVEAGFRRMGEQLGITLPVFYCPHPPGPPICWCRKPLPGLGVLLIERYRLDAARCIYVAAGPQDPTFARRLGFQYRDAAKFFGR